MTDLNEQIIAEFRANGGVVTTGGFGDTLIILHSIGAKSGQVRINPLLGLPTGDGAWLVAASKAGAPQSPGWYFNLVAHPRTKIEAGNAIVPVVATDLKGPERDEAWGRFTSHSDVFEASQAKAGDRLIPVIRLDPR